MTTAAYLIVSLALGVAIGGILLAAGVAVFVLRAGMPGGIPAGRDGSRPARDCRNGDEITNWRGGK